MKVIKQFDVINEQFWRFMFLRFTKLLIEIKIESYKF